ncbi:VWA domain-containing protein [Ideonella sp. 4Y11]|uniref:VWA domain-containing protein n=1 Tax=Ideonella aquatica TaxID=2824119 RepID=A0A940YM31_9BURK|nr:VWA domain-containing protein [Ideonella aquatica]MBQ0961112.1 VWA domain-containing protein [Ideonella aquatica]
MLLAPRVESLPGHLAENVLHFARVLRHAGLPVGTDRVQLALTALRHGGLESKRDFHAALAACFIDRAEHRTLFDQAFHIFWKDPDLEGRMRALLLPKVQTHERAADAPPENRRLAGALFPNMPERPSTEPPRERIDVQATLTFSEREVLRQKDFDTMTKDEWQQARQLLQRLATFFEPLPTRRQQPAARGTPDWRASLAAMARLGGDTWVMRHRQPRRRPAPLVVLADISGSMSNYSRMLLHFTHALSHADLRVHSFVFGTRLTPITRALRQRDPDIAVGSVARQVVDWSGGTRLSASLHSFNRHWARRVLSSRSTVLLITDGLEHGDTAALGFETERLAKSCRQLVWLNPLLRYDAFEARAAGIQAMRPHVHRFLPVHNLASLQALAEVLAGRAGPVPAL